MTKLERQKENVRIMMSELLEQLVSFAALIIFTLLEGLYLFILVELHEPADTFREHFALCPLKIVILLTGVSFLLLNLLTVTGFIVTHAYATVKMLKKTLRREIPRKRNGSSTAPSTTGRGRAAASLSRPPSLELNCACSGA
jgi:hypothetical protein